MAVIKVKPSMNITALIASDIVNEGDVLLLEEGIYFQAVNIRKNNIRIIAKGPGVIFDGKGTLITAFRLLDVVGVAIEGVNIGYYIDNGIQIESGSGNRAVNNIIHNMVDTGVEIIRSSGNLIWKNEICNCRSGISLIIDSTNNWIIENIVKESLSTAFTTSQTSVNNNAFISNRAIRNGGTGFNINDSNNLLMDNLIIDNVQGVTIFGGSNSLAIGNKIKGSKTNALSVFNEYRNYFAGENHIVCNFRSGINNIGEFGIFVNNELSYNADNGITLSPFSIGNLIMDNKLVCNLPGNLIDSGADNNLINNIEKPCEPCEAPSEICGDCSDKERKCHYGSN